MFNIECYEQYLPINVNFIYCQMILYNNAESCFSERLKYLNTCKIIEYSYEKAILHFSIVYFDCIFFTVFTFLNIYPVKISFKKKVP